MFHLHPDNMLNKAAFSLLLSVLLILNHASHAGRYNNRQIGIEKCDFGLCLESASSLKQPEPTEFRPKMPDIRDYMPMSRRPNPHVPNSKPFEEERERKVENIMDCSYGMCERSDVDDYPAREIELLLERTPQLHSYFGTVLERPNKPVTIDSRYNTDNEEETFCSSIQQTRRPVKMVDVDRLERTIVNVGKFTQVVQFETCDPGNTHCFAHNFLLDYHTGCSQKFILMQLIYADLQYNTTSYGKFLIPSNCVCVYKKKMF